MGDVIIKILGIVIWPLVWLIDRLATKGNPKNEIKKPEPDNNITPRIARAIKDAKEETARKNKGKN